MDEDDADAEVDVLSGLQAEGIMDEDDADAEVDVVVIEEKSEAGDVPLMTNDSSDPIGFQEEKVTKEDVVNGSEGTDIETAVGTKEELDTSTDSLETSDNTESLLQQKMVNCKRVVNEMMRLSVQAKQ